MSNSWEQQVRLMEANQVGVEERRGRVSGNFHSSRRAEEQTVTEPPPQGTAPDVPKRGPGREQGNNRWRARTLPWHRSPPPQDRMMRMSWTGRKHRSRHPLAEQQTQQLEVSPGPGQRAEQVGQDADGGSP